MILFILPSLSGGGAERVTVNYLLKLHSRGYPVGLVLFKKEGPLLKIIPEEITIYNLDTITLKKSIIPIVRIVRKLRPNIVFSTFGYINTPLLACRWLLPSKTKIWIREANLSSISLSNNPYSRLMMYLYRLLYKKADKVICTSERMKDEFVVDYLVHASNTEVLPNPVDIDTIRKSSISIERFDKGGVCYVAAGRLTFQKGFDRLLKWFADLDEKTSTLVILGDGDLKDELAEESEVLGVQDRVKIKGFCNNPWQWYAGADVFLLSSRWEGMPNVVLESLACGTPVIATEESGGVRELANQVGDNNLIVATSSLSFINEMSKIKPNLDNKIKKSMLPEEYHIDYSVSILEKLLKH
jgi:glycosyltransferase involved in cell wall biosynthesis